MIEIPFVIVFCAFAVWAFYMGRNFRLAQKNKPAIAIIIVATILVSLALVAINATNPIPSLIWTGISILAGFAAEYYFARSK